MFVIVVIVALVLYVGSVLCVFVVVLYWYRCGNVYVVLVVRNQSFKNKEKNI